MTEQLVAAWHRRVDLHDLDAYRVLHGWSEGMSGVEIDRYADTAIISYKPAAAPDPQALAATLRDLHPFALVVAKPRDAAPFAVHGELSDEPRQVRELDVTFCIEPAQPRNPGLHLDARPARRWIRDNSGDRRVLNLFSFTGSLGVTAAAGGARSVTHVDSQRGALKRCEANHAVNGLPIDDRDLVAADIYEHLRRAAKKRRGFDAIIVDAPPYLDADATDSNRPRAQTGVLALARLTAPVLNPGGWVLCFFHHSQLDHDAHERAFCAAAGVDLTVLWRDTSGIDFPEADPRNKLRLTAFQRPA